MKELKSLSSIFKEKLFRIPDYQRGYAWGAKQLVEFWEDLINLGDDRYHYTGVISLKEVEKKIWKKWNEEEWLITERNYEPYFVVDGQQRLTTSIILIQTLIELVQSFPENEDKLEADIILGSYTLKDIIEDYVLVKQPPKNIVKSYKFGYEKDNPSFDFLRHQIFNEPLSGTLQETFYTLNLENAKSFFKENLEELYEEEGAAAITNLYKKLTLRLMFNVYEIDENFDVFVAFETMNNRGKQLSDLELLKNRLIYLTTLYNRGEVKENEKNKIRSNINQAWKDVYHQLGRNKKHPLNDNDFLRAHWIMYFKYSRQKGNDYIRFLLDEQFNPKNVLEKVTVRAENMQDVEEITDVEVYEETDNENGYEEVAKLSIKQIDDYVLSLQKAAKFWHISFFPYSNEITPEEQLWIGKLNRIGIGHFRPLVLSSFANDKISAKKRVKLFKAIERLIFLGYRIKRSQSNWLSSEFYRTAKSVYWNEITIETVIQSIKNNIKWMFDDEDDYFKHNEFYDYIHKNFKTNGSGFYGWNGLRYFLFEYEEYIRPELRDNKLEWENLKNEGSRISIEHILPQTADKKYWKKAFEDVSDKKMVFLKGSIGNLLPLSSSINSSLQNDGFHKKRVVKQDKKGKTIRNGYENGSYSEQEVAKYVDWNAQTIKERSIKLLDFMEERWKIKFKNEQEKVKLLHLEFVDD